MCFDAKKLLARCSQDSSVYLVYFFLLIYMATCGIVWRRTSPSHPRLTVVSSYAVPNCKMKLW